MISLLMEGGCNTYPWIAALKSAAPEKYARICRTVRTDGAYSEAVNDEAQDLLAQPNALGIVGFADLMNMPEDRGLAISRLDGVAATQQAIESGSYPASRGIYVYDNRSRPRRAVVPFFFPFQFSTGEIVALPEPQRHAAVDERLR
jgi:phosphate transport system substrate-binding protein